MAADSYRRQVSYYQDISGSLTVTTAATSSTLVTARNTSQTIFIQKIHVEVTTSAAQTWSFTDSAGTPVNIVPSVSTAAIAHFDFDFGPLGVPCTAGKNFLLTISSAGAAGQITWEGYQKLSGTTAVSLA